MSLCSAPVRRMINNGNIRPHNLCAGEAPDEKLKLNELGPYVNSPYNSLTLASHCISILIFIHRKAVGQPPYLPQW